MILGISFLEDATQTMILYGTGLGAGLNADNVAPQAGNLPTKVEVFVGGQAAAMAYTGRSPCCSGLDQIVFTVPPNAPLGCWVPVQIRTSGTTVSNTTTMAISANGSPCSDPLNALTASFLAGDRKSTRLNSSHRALSRMPSSA